MIPLNDKITILKDAIDMTLDVIDQSSLTPEFSSHPDKAKSTAFSILLPHVIQAVQDEYDGPAETTVARPDNQPQCEFTFRSGHAKVRCQLRQHEGDTHQVMVTEQDLVNIGIDAREA